MKGLRKCVVMEVKGSVVYLLAEGGAFFKISWRGAVPEVGEEVFVRIPSRFASVSRWTQGALVACLAIFLFIASAALSYHYTPRAAAYVSLDIKPSIELLVSTGDRVMEARALNRDGERILKEVYLLGIPGERAVQIIVQKAAQHGYLTRNRYNIVLIAVTPVRGKGLRPELKKRLVAEAQGVMDLRHIRGTAKEIETTPDVRERAQKLGLSPGRYALLLESLGSNLNVSPEDLREKSISEVLQEAGGNISKILNSVTEGTLETIEKSLETGPEEQGAQKSGAGITPLLNDIFNPVVSGLTQTLLPQAGNGVPEVSAPLSGTGYQEKTLTEAGEESQPFLEKTLEPVKENIFEPISKNILSPLDNLLGNPGDGK